MGGFGERERRGRRERVKKDDWSSDEGERKREGGLKRQRM